MAKQRVMEGFMRCFSALFSDDFTKPSVANQRPQPLFPRVLMTLIWVKFNRGFFLLLTLIISVVYLSLAENFVV
jgi:hypothetical protein